MNASECDYNELAFDEACLVLSTNDQDYNATLYSLSSDCISCPYSKVSWIEQERNKSIKLSTGKFVTWRVYNDSGMQDFRSAADESGIVCQFQPNLGEYGIYELTIDNEGCEFDAIREPDNSYTPLAIIFGSILCVLLVFSLVRLCIPLLRRKCTKGRNADECNTAGENCSPPTAKNNKLRRRVLSIDTFRGMSILAMIFVNNGAGGYVFLEHATWNGLLIGDLIFPSFVWIMGVCIPIALSSQLTRGISRFSISRAILKRSIVLFLVGLVVNSGAVDSDLERLRIFGVLQRFAVAYLVVGVLYTFLSPREEKKFTEDQLQRTTQGAVFVSNAGGKFTDFLSLAPQWIAILAITALHCAITFCLPVAGCPTGYLGPGGRHADGRYWNCTGGATGHIDEIILGNNHLYQHSAIKEVYGSPKAFDPEGILGCLTTILQTFLGVQTGKILRVQSGWKERVVRWLVLALLCGCIGSALHFINIIPVNKNLWSVSFVLVTSSFALALFTACYLLVDVMTIWGGGPFRIPGMNALVMYVGHQICYNILPFHWKYGAMESHAWLTISAVWNVGAWTLVAYCLHRKRIYISV